MFNIGEFVVYGNNGVCRVEAVGPMELSGVASEKMYYTLVPIYQNDRKVFTPVDNDKVLMRAVISKEEAEELINNIENIGTLEEAEGKKTEDVFKNSMKSGKCEEWIKVIKTIYTKKQIRLAQGKKSTTCDEKYFRFAEDSLYGELAVALEIPRNEVKDFIFQRINEINN